MSVKRKLGQNGFHVVELVIVFVVLGVIGLVGYKVLHKNKNQSSGSVNDQASVSQMSGNNNPTSIDPITRGKAFSSGACQGSGSKKLGSLPMRTSQMSIVIP